MSFFHCFYLELRLKLRYESSPSLELCVAITEIYERVLRFVEKGKQQNWSSAKRLRTTNLAKQAHLVIRSRKIVGGGGG